MQSVYLFNHGGRCIKYQKLMKFSSHVFFGRKVLNTIYLKQKNREDDISKTKIPLHQYLTTSHTPKVNERKNHKRRNNSSWLGFKLIATSVIGCSLLKYYFTDEKSEKNIQQTPVDPLNPLNITVSIIPLIASPVAGSGFFYNEKGHVVTCAHVASKGILWYCESLHNSGIYTVAGRDDRTDVAVLKPVFRTKPPVSLESYNRKKYTPTFRIFQTINISAYDYLKDEFVTLKQLYGIIYCSVNTSLIQVFSSDVKPGYSGGIVTTQNCFEGMITKSTTDRVPVKLLVYANAKTIDYCAKKPY